MWVRAMKPIPKLDDLHPDGVRVVVNWDAMSVGMSVFIPCINTEMAEKQLAKISERREISLQVQERIEDGRFGLRVWRTL
jgi:hypothetical protein